jgi:hypothetical protein
MSNNKSKVKFLCGEFSRYGRSTVLYRQSDESILCDPCRPGLARRQAADPKSESLKQSRQDGAGKINHTLKSTLGRKTTSAVQACQSFFPGVIAVVWFDLHGYSGEFGSDEMGPEGMGW